MAAITQTSRHLLRYLAAAVVVNRRRRAAVKDLVRILVAESHAYSDPVTRFLVALFDRHDFDAAQAALADCDALLRADFFLVGLRDEFLDRGRAFLFEQYVRVHTAIDLKALSARLAMPQEEAERWVVNLIRNERLPATVDLVGGTVRMAPPGGSVYDATVERAKTLNARTAQLAAAVAAMPALGHA